MIFTKGNAFDCEGTESMPDTAQGSIVQPNSFTQ